jgi:F-type H+-transporting ATPase subunit b
MEDISPIAWIFTHSAAFILLVWIMKKFAWGPILGLLDERRDSVEESFAKAEQLKADAERMQAENKEQLQAAHAEARELVKKAQADAGKLREQLQAETQAQIEKARKEASARIAQETEAAKNQLRNYVADLAVSATEKFLTEGLSDDQKRKLTDETLPEIERAAARN